VSGSRTSLDVCGEAPQTGAPRIASDRHLHRLAATQGSKEMNPYEDGLARGRYWAEHHAGPSELKNLQALRTAKSAEGWCQWFTGHDASQPAFKRLVQVLHPHTSGSAGDVAEFWRGAVAFDAATPQRAVRDSDFVRGFADGALEVWRASGGAGERGSETPDEEWLDEHGGPSSANDT
jgi:hypothetical protein